MWLSGLAVCVLLPLGACANAPWASQLQETLAADPQLQASPLDASPSPEASPDPGETQLPLNFPAEIPRYPNAELVAVTGADQSGNIEVGSNPETQTRWRTSDTAAQVWQFYQEKFQSAGWQLASNAASTDQPLEATRDGLQVSVTTTAGEDRTEFSIDYQFNNAATGNDANPTASPTVTADGTADGADGAIPQPGDPAFIGPVLPDERTAQADSAPASPSSNGDGTTSFSDLDQAPAELQPYIADLTKLEALPMRTNGTSGEFKPNAEISRRDYARWLVTANNRIYANQPARKIRLAAATDQATFQDVPSSDPDFDVIQGLANAGLIPSSLSGDSNAVTFRPDAPLTREELILWKVPVDMRQVLPNASIDTIQQTWGFQDATKIDPRAMRAVLADFQNGDLSNIRRAFGYTTLFQPQKTVSRAEAAAVLWQFGTQGNNLSAKDATQISQSAQ